MSENGKSLHMVQKISNNILKGRPNSSTISPKITNSVSALKNAQILPHLVSERNNVRIEFLQLYDINPQMLTSHWLESYTFIDFCDVIILGQCFIGQWLLSGQILVLLEN